ncbi:MAG TPA: C4-type zinc ribbon domain-containing protein [Bryobacteraceae bacterium]|nr:C4-type zinc ribbon domain-containing protein [Bryobacteraceae bacterium]
MLPDIQHAIRLQILDDRVTALTKEIATLPKHIAEIEKKLESHLRRLDHDKAALVGNLKDRKRLEGDIQTHDQKISKLKGQMMEAKTNEQYRAFQQEIDFAGQEIRKAEDRILELMSEAEPLDRNVKAAEASLASEKKLVEQDKAEARERTAADQKEIETLRAERAGIMAQMTPSVAANYERIRKGRGVAVSEVSSGRCSKCNIALRPQFFQELKKGDQIMTCESCGRILYYNPPQAVEDLGGRRINMSAGTGVDADA